MIDISKYKVNELDIIVCKPYLHQISPEIKRKRLTVKALKKLVELIREA